MVSISTLFTRFSRNWVTLLATAVFILFMIFVLPAQAAQSVQNSAGLGSPDTSFWYTPEELLGFAESYGEAGRQAYIRARWTFDLIYPLVYGIFLISSLSWLLAFRSNPDWIWRRLNLVPFAGVIFDYLENISTTLVMARFPDPVPLVINLAPILSLIKWILVSLSFIILIYAAARALFIRLTYRYSSI